MQSWGWQQQGDQRGELLWEQRAAERAQHRSLGTDETSQRGESQRIGFSVPRRVALPSSCRRRGCSRPASEGLLCGRGLQLLWDQDLVLSCTKMGQGASAFPPPRKSGVAPYFVFCRNKQPRRNAALSTLS